MQYHIEQIDGRLTGFIMSYYVSYNFYVSDREDTVFVEHANRPIAYTICEYSLLSVNKTTDDGNQLSRINGKKSAPAIKGALFSSHVVCTSGLAMSITRGSPSAAPYRHALPR